MMKSKVTMFLLSLATTGVLLSQGVTAVYAKGNNDNDHKPPKQEEKLDPKEDTNNNPPGHNDCKPGWGLGDKNHKHCGPPGHSTQPPGPPPTSDQPTSEKDEMVFAWLWVKTDDLVKLFNSNFGNWIGQFHFGSS